MKKIILATIITISVLTHAFSQQTKLDSLENLLGQSYQNQLVDVLNQIANELLDSDKSKAIKYAGRADSLSRILNYQKGNASAQLYLGILRRDRGEYETALTSFQASLKTAQTLQEKSLIHDIMFETGITNYRMGDFDAALKNFDLVLKFRISENDQKGISNTKNEIGNVNLFQSNYNTALQLYFEALKIREELSLMGKASQTLNNIGLVYMYQEDLDEALNYLRKSLELKKQYSDQRSVAKSHNNIGLILELKEDFNGALTEYFEALDYLDPATDQSIITTLYNNIGLIYNGLEKYDQALTYLKKTLAVKEKMGEKMEIAQAYTSIGKTYKLKRDFRQAVNFGLKGYDLALDIKSKKEIFEAAESLAEIFESNGNYKNALVYEKISNQYEDSLRNDSQSREIGRLEAEYKFEKEKAEEDKARMLKEKEEEIARNRTTVIVISGFGVLLIILIAAIFYTKSLNKKNKVISNQNEKLESTIGQLKETQSQLVQSEKMASLGVLTAGIAHEINNPVNFITTSIQGLRELVKDQNLILNEYAKVYGDENDNISRLKKEVEFDEITTGVTELIENIELGSERTAEIVSGLKAFSHTEDHEMVLTDINKNIDSTLLIMKNKYRDKIRIEKKYGDLPEVKCFPGKLNQVFMNIIGNAVDAVESKEQISAEDEIKITTKLMNGNVQIEVFDTGPGIDDDLLEKIFDPFFTTKDIGKGTGLGLAISFGIVNDHNGSIKVQSEKNKFTKFIITIPV